MLASIAHWIELSFWQLAVNALTLARPISKRVAHFQRPEAGPGSIDLLPLQRILRHSWFIALGGWLLGLALGWWIAS